MAALMPMAFLSEDDYREHGARMEREHGPGNWLHDSQDGWMFLPHRLGPMQWYLDQLGDA